MRRARIGDDVGRAVQSLQRRRERSRSESLSRSAICAFYDPQEHSSCSYALPRQFFSLVVKFSSSTSVSTARTVSVHRCHEITRYKLKGNGGDEFLVQALYDFSPRYSMARQYRSDPGVLNVEQGELEFRRGDIITVTDRSDQHWWTGEHGARRGLFPPLMSRPTTIRALPLATRHRHNQNQSGCGIE
ncbi:hypothetical protein TCAL_16781 [Tigriopus californicus]|uniref:SH3 domain-containing protein n=1 Tax=Tigriopus californicus TaxID=6832 RepID=A0A553PRW0_TIGCA|nr:hypothetical protein TCAL_16781 [Tigriopus californicus]